MRYAYFPGCIALGGCSELDDATREVAKESRIELVDLDEAACCGGGNLQVANPEAAGWRTTPTCPGRSLPPNGGNAAWNA